MKVWIVTRNIPGVESDILSIARVFDNEEKAKKYEQVANERNKHRGWSYDVDDREVE